MVPLTKIALIVMAYWRRLGDRAVPQVLFDAMMLACLVTAVVAPVATAWLLDRLPVDARSDP
jgi:hypothetical protein